MVFQLITSVFETFPVSRRGSQSSEKRKTELSAVRVSAERKMKVREFIRQEFGDGIGIVREQKTAYEISCTVSWARRCV